MTGACLVHSIVSGIMFCEYFESVIRMMNFLLVLRLEPSPWYKCLDTERKRSTNRKYQTDIFYILISPLYVLHYITLIPN